MSKNAKKFQKRQAGKHNQRCSVTPDKVRYRDLEQAKNALFHFKRNAKEQKAATGSTTYNQKRPYECSACKGYHTTSQELGRVKNEVVREKELTIADLILSA